MVRCDHSNCVYMYMYLTICTGTLVEPTCAVRFDDDGGRKVCVVLAVCVSRGVCECM